MSLFRQVFVPAVALLAIGLAALLAIVGMTYWLGERSSVYFEEVIAARDARIAAVELRSALQTAEASERGYLLSGNQIYLAPYSTARARAEAELAILRALVGKDEAARPVLARLSSLIAEKSSQMDTSIALKRDRRDDEALGIFRTNRGKALMDEANVFLSGLIRAADSRLTASLSEQTHNAARLRQATILGGLVIVLVVGLVVGIILRYARDLRIAHVALSQLNLDLEQRVRTRTMELTRANEELQRFTHIVSHDLRAPLVNIVGFTGEIEAGIQRVKSAIERPVERAASDAARAAVDVEMPEAIGFIRSSANRMEALIRAMLKVAREGGRELRPESVDLADTIEVSLAAIRHQIGAADGVVDVELEVRTLEVDRLSLEQILGNLLDNAVKYRSPTRPFRLRVSTRARSDGMVEISIGDNGRGIAPSDIDRVFEPFRRSGVQDQQGEGIGLTYVRAIARHLGGEVMLNSQIDVGTTFRVLLPTKPIETKD